MKHFDNENESTTGNKLLDDSKLKSISNAFHRHQNNFDISIDSNGRNQQ